MPPMTPEEKKPAPLTTEERPITSEQIRSEERKIGAPVTFKEKKGPPVASEERESAATPPEHEEPAPLSSEEEKLASLPLEERKRPPALPEEMKRSDRMIEGEPKPLPSAVEGEEWRSKQELERELEKMTRTKPSSQPLRFSRGGVTLRQAARKVKGSGGYEEKDRPPGYQAWTDKPGVVDMSQVPLGGPPSHAAYGKLEDKIEGRQIESYRVHQAMAGALMADEEAEAPERREGWSIEKDFPENLPRATPTSKTGQMKTSAGKEEQEAGAEEERA